MIRKYLEKNKHSIWPWITDWTDPQDHLRKEKDVNKLTHMEWFFFHPTAYALLTVGSNLISIVLFSILTIIGLIKGIKSAIIIGIIMTLAATYQYNKKRKEYKLSPDTTFYDIWMREYK